MIGGNVSRFFQKGQITPDSRLCPLIKTGRIMAEL